MKKFTKKLYNLLRSAISKRILYLIGIGAVSFVFEACYGTPQASDLNKNYQLKGKLLTIEGKPAANMDIIASSSSDLIQTMTNKDGCFSMDINGQIHEKLNISVINGKGETSVVLPAEDHNLSFSFQTSEKE